MNHKILKGMGIGLGIFLVGGALLYPGALPGADDRVMKTVEGYAQEVGVQERAPLINTDKGDLMLFLFAAGGGVAGFWIGYNWRDLFPKQGEVKR